MSILATALLFIYLSYIFGKSEGLASVQSPKSQALQQSTDIEASNERTVVILFHKPANVLTSHLSEDSRSTVYSEVQSMKGFISQAKNDKSHLSFDQATGILSKLHSIGRLDADTTGLLLLTNDGGLVHHVTNPNAPTHTTDGAITKTYEALIMGDHDEESLDALWHGVDIGAKYGGMTQPVDALKILDHPNHKSTVVSITISEGKNRQVRRMFHALGSGVMKLKRTHVGEHLTLEGVQEGQWRIMSEQEVLEFLQWKPRSISELPVAALKKKEKPDGGAGSLPPSNRSHMNNKRRRRRRGS
jgi:23S rRNA pseudouridine2605 synthase